MDDKNEPCRWSREEKESAYMNCTSMLNWISIFIDTMYHVDTFSPKELESAASYLRDYSDQLADLLLIKTECMGCD